MEHDVGSDCVNGSDTNTSDTITSNHRFYTHCSDENYSFSWTLPDFSNVLKEVYFEFSTTSNATRWRVVLDIPNHGIYLVKCSDGPAVDVTIRSKILVNVGDLDETSQFKFGRFHSALLLKLPSYFPRNLKNNVVEFRCIMTIKTHFISHRARLTDFKSIAQKKVPHALRDILARQVHCDTTICFNTEKMEVHRAILCARSPYFDRMFRKKMLEIKYESLEINDIDTDTFKSFILFLYAGEVDLSFDKASKLYRVAVKYEVEDLRKLCSKILVSTLTLRRFSLVYELAQEFKDETLKSDTIQFFQMFSTSDKRAVEERKKLMKKYPELAGDKCYFNWF